MQVGLYVSSYLPTLPVLVKYSIWKCAESGEICENYIVCAGGREKGIRVAAATYLKNFLKAHWSAQGAISCDEKLEFRNQLVDELLRVDGLVLKLLAEAVSAFNPFYLTHRTIGIVYQLSSSSVNWESLHHTLLTFSTLRV